MNEPNPFLPPDVRNNERQRQKIIDRMGRLKARFKPLVDEYNDLCEALKQLEAGNYYGKVYYTNVQKFDQDFWIAEMVRTYMPPEHLPKCIERKPIVKVLIHPREDVPLKLKGKA